MKNDNKVGQHDIFQTWASLPKKTQEFLKHYMKSASSLEDFISSTMVGDCPKCGSIKVTDCEVINGIKDSTIGLCLTCGYLWCLECQREFKGIDECGHWKICEECSAEKDEFGTCDIPVAACEKSSGISDPEIRQEILNRATILKSNGNDPLSS